MRHFSEIPLGFLKELMTGSHRIEAVKIVPGSELNHRWKEMMQVVTTHRGVFIDNLPGRQFGFYVKASPGYEWQAKIGETVTGVKVFEWSGHQWLNKQ